MKADDGVDATHAGQPAAGLVRRARLLAWATIAWNVVEAVVAIAAGSAAGSLALVGFGVDSSIEVLSAFVVLWRLNDGGQQREQRALRLIGVSFFLLAAWIVVQSVRSLAAGTAPEVSRVGIVLTGLSLVVMPLLARAKQTIGRAMHSPVVLADAIETWLCTSLSAIVLAGLALNAAFGWWWADPVAALGIAWLAVREGREALEGDHDH